jgi:hypothetical protein
MSERALGWTSVVVFGLVALLAAAGAARSPEAIVVGRPGVLALGGVILVIALVALQPPADRRILLGLAVVPVLLLFGWRSAAAGALSGAPLLAVVAAALWALGLPWERWRVAFVPVVAALYLYVSVGVQRRVGPQGDEPHYLMVSESILRDHDVSLEKDYEEGRYRAFFKGDTLLPHFRVRGLHGEIYSLHAVGLSLLVLPAYALAGYPGASIFMALLAVLAAIAIRSLLRAVAVREGDADAVAWIVALSPPLVHYAGLIFTEVPAALVVAFALREGLRAREISLPRAMAVAAAIAFLPWLNVRYAIVAGLLWLYWAWMRPRRAVLVAHVTAGVASIIGLMAYHHALYGFYDPRRVYGNQREFSADTLATGVPGLLLDQEFGLFVYAPVFVLALPGLVRLVRRRSPVGIAATALVGVVFAVAAAWPMWRGGFNPPARFLLPVVPALAIGVAAWMENRRSAATALLVGWGLFTGIAGAYDPSLVHRDRDVTAPLFRADSGATEWTRLLPRYVLPEEPVSRRTGLASVWTCVLLVAVWGSRRALRPGSLAFGLVVLAIGAEAAARVSEAPAGGREAARLLPGPAFALPPGGLGTRRMARWTAADLAWGPVYQPHRHSGTAAVGERLRLPEGRYRLGLEAQPLGGAGVPPTIVVYGSDGRPIGRAACESSGAAAWACAFDVPPRTPEVTLILEGGSPFDLKGISLALNPTGPPPV